MFPPQLSSTRSFWFGISIPGLYFQFLFYYSHLNHFPDKTIGWRWNAWGSTWGIIVDRMIPLPWRSFPILSFKEQSNPLSLILGFPSTHYRHNRQTTKSKERPGKQLWSTVSPSIFHYFIKIIHCIVPSFYKSKSINKSSKLHQ